MSTQNEQEMALNAVTAGLAEVIREHLPEGVGFALLLFDLGDRGFMSWASNARRADMVKALREMASKLETRGVA